MTSSDEHVEPLEPSPPQSVLKMEELSIKLMSGGSAFILWVLALIAALWLSIAWTIKPADRTSADFFCIFYPAATVASQGKYSDLYPQASSPSYETPHLTAEAKRLFPTFDNSRISIFPYPPALALVLAPLASVTPLIAFNIVSFISLASIAIAYSLLAQKKNLRKTLLVTFLSISFGPFWQNLSLGQMSIWLGVGIISIGYWACLRKRLTAAGLIWSILILKPVFLVAPGLIALSLALDKKFKLAISMALGGLAILGASAAYFSINVLSQWLHLVRLVEQAILQNDHDLSLYMVVGLVSATTASLPDSLKLFAKNFMYVVSVGSSLAFVFYLCHRIRQQKPWRSVLPKAMVAAISFTPIIAPYMRFYDLSIIWVAAILILETELSRSEWLYMLRFLSASFVVMEIYFWLILTAPHWHFTQPLLFLTIFLFLQFKIVSHYLSIDFAPPTEAN